MTALQQVERQLIGVDRSTTAATDRMGAGFQRAGAAAQQSAARVSASTRQMGQAYGNVANQIADFAVQVQAGTNPVRALTQQLSQSLIFFGPWGAAAGAAAAILGGLATAFTNVGENSDEAADRLDVIKDALGRLSAVARDSTTDVGDLIESISEMSAEMQAVATAGLAAAIDAIGAAAEQTARDLDELITKLDTIGPDAATRIRAAIATGGIGTGIAQAMREGVGEGLPGLLEAGAAMAEVFRQRFSEIPALELVAPEQEAAVQRIAADLERASAAGDTKAMAALSLQMSTVVEQAEFLAKGLDIDAPAQKALAALRQMRDKMIGLVRATQQLKEEQAAGAEALTRLSKGARIVSTTEFGPPEPPAPPRTSTAQQATFQDILGPMQERLDLLEQTELTESQISAILGAQARLKRDLSDIERDALIEVGASLDAERERHALAERQTKASESLTTSLDAQLDRALLLLQHGGEETDEYKLQLALLQAKRQAMGDLTEEQRLLVIATRAATEQAEQDARKLALIRRTDQAKFGSSQALEAGMSDITGLPPRKEFFAQQERFRLQQEGRSAAEIVEMEPLIQDLARAQQHLQLMTDTAPKLAHTLTELSQIAISEGFEEAGARFLEMMGEMILEAIILQTIMAAIGMASGTPGVTPSGAGMHGMLGHAQHGARVRKDQPFIVGEAGPELFVPDAAGQVHSNPDTSRMLAGGGGRGAGGGGGGDVRVDARPVINIHTPPNTETRTEEREGEGGEGPRIDVMIDEMVAANLRPGTNTSRALEGRFGLKYQTRR